MSVYICTFKFKFLWLYPHYLFVRILLRASSLSLNDFFSFVLFFRGRGGTFMYLFAALSREEHSVTFWYSSFVWVEKRAEMCNYKNIFIFPGELYCLREKHFFDFYTAILKEIEKLWEEITHLHIFLCCLLTACYIIIPAINNPFLFCQLPIH